MSERKYVRIDITKLLMDYVKNTIKQEITLCTTCKNGVGKFWGKELKGLRVVDTNSHKSGINIKYI